MARSLALLLAAQTAAAQIVAVPPAAGVAAAGSASASVTAAPFVQYGALKKGDITAAHAFLKTPALQEWLLASRPEKAAEALTQARRLADFGEIAKIYGRVPDRMRWAILARTSDKGFQSPAAASRLIAANPPLEGSYEAIREAYCAWVTLADNERAGLTARGHDERAWSGYSLPERVARLREMWIEVLQRRIPVSPLDPQYAPTLRSFLKRAGGYVNDEERAAMELDADRSERLAARVVESRDRAVKSGDLETLEALEGVGRTGDVDSARAEFDRVFTGAGGEERLTEVPQEIPAEVLAHVAAGLFGAVRALAEGTAAAKVLDEAAAEKQLQVAFERTSARAIAHYEPWADRLVFNPDDLSEYLRSENRVPGELLTDKGLLLRYALALGPVFVHEATHARQHRLLARRGLGHGGPYYQQAMEIEAFAQQGAFIRGLAAKRPKAYVLAQEYAGRTTLRRLMAGWREHPNLVSTVRGTYKRLAGSHRAWIRGHNAIRQDLEPYRPHARGMAAVLARRSRLSVEERTRLGREGHERGPFSGYRTGVLRKLLRYLDGTSGAAIALVNGANEEIMANARLSLAAFHALRPETAAPQR